MTAVEWFWDKIDDIVPDSYRERIMLLAKQAKQMEKEQIIDAFYQCGRDNFEHIKVINRSATDYYNETYGSNGSDDKQKESLDFLVSQAQEMGLYDTSSKTEISDEEIEKWIDSTPYYGHCTTEYKEGLGDGIKWYREQLKQRQ